LSISYTTYKARFLKNSYIEIDASQNFKCKKIQDSGSIPAKENDLVFFIIVPLDNARENLVNEHQSHVEQVIDEDIQQQQEAEVYFKQLVAPV
jgi:hypothetical protein